MSALGNLSARMRGTNISELSKAAKSGNVDEVSRLCGTGNPNARDPDGDRFPLHYLIFKQTASHLPHEANVEQAFPRAGQLANPNLDPKLPWQDGDDWHEQGQLCAADQLHQGALLLEMPLQRRHCRRPRGVSSRPLPSAQPVEGRGVARKTLESWVTHGSV